MVLPSLGLAALAIYISLLLSIRAFSLWWIIFIFMLPLMAPSSPTRPRTLAQRDDLTVEAIAPHSPTPIEGVETPRRRMPSSPTPATFSEALVLGVGGLSSTPTSTGIHEPTTDRPSEVPPPSQSLSMHNLCLLGKPWGESIPLSIVMSKTHKDWSFVKGQIDYLELGNGWLLFRFANLHDISMVWNGRPWHVSGLNLVL